MSDLTTHTLSYVQGPMINNLEDLEREYEHNDQKLEEDIFAIVQEIKSKTHPLDRVFALNRLNLLIFIQMKQISPDAVTRIAEVMRNLQNKNI